LRRGDQALRRAIRGTLAALSEPRLGEGTLGSEAEHGRSRQSGERRVLLGLTVSHNDLVHATLLRTVKNDELCVRFTGIPAIGPLTA
jgi:hypothetical protein